MNRILICRLSARQQCISQDEFYGSKLFGAEVILVMRQVLSHLNVPVLIQATSAFLETATQAGGMV